MGSAAEAGWLKRHWARAALARVINRGRTTGVYSVEVRNDRGKLVACGQINGFATGKPLIEEES